MVGMVITIMATIITDQITIQIMIIVIIVIIIIQTDILPQHILQDATREIILNLPCVIIMYPGGKPLLVTHPAMLQTLTVAVITVIILIASIIPIASIIEVSEVSIIAETTQIK